MDSKLEEVLKDAAKFVERMYAQGHSHTPAQELLTRIREELAKLQQPPGN